MHIGAAGERLASVVPSSNSTQLEPWALGLWICQPVGFGGLPGRGTPILASRRRRCSRGAPGRQRAAVAGAAGRLLGCSSHY